MQQRIKAFEDAHAQSVAQAADFVQRVRGHLAGVVQRMNTDSFGASRPAAAGAAAARPTGPRHVEVLLPTQEELDAIAFADADDAQDQEQEGAALDRGCSVLVAGILLS